MRLWMFDRSGVYSSEKFDINKEPEQFVKVIAGYALMTDSELGLNTFIKRDGNDKYIVAQEVNIYLEDKPIARAPNGWWILWISTDIRGFGGCGLDSRWIGCRVGGCGFGYGWMTNRGEEQHGCPNWVVSSPNWLLSLSYSHSPYFPVICKYHQLNQFSS